MGKISPKIALGSFVIVGLIMGCGGVTSSNFESLFVLRSTGTSFKVISTAGYSDNGSSTAITGLQGGEQVLAVDVRPVDGVLYGITNQSRIYTINTNTGAATVVGTPLTLTGTPDDIEFNPVVDRIRVITNSRKSYRVNPTTGALAATDTDIAYATGDPNVGSFPIPGAMAYTNSTSTAPVNTTAYILEDVVNTLTTLGSVNGTPTSPNAGQLFTVVGTTPSLSGTIGFDISGKTGVGYVLNASNQLFTINSLTGLMNLRTTLASGANDIAVLP